MPFIFSSATILAKDPKSGEAVPWNPSPQRWIDGSVDNDLPMTRLAELFNVNHFIVSQVNPHVVPFLVKEEDSIAQEAQRSTATIASGPTWLHSLTHLAKGEALHRMHTMAELGVFPNTLSKAVSVLSQKYSGDITILPEISYADFPHMLSNPTTEFMLQAQLSGERATWPKLSRIKNHCAIELALDDAVHKLRARVAFSPSQVDLRLDAHIISNWDMKKGRKGKLRNRQRPLSQNSAPGCQASTHSHQARDEDPNIAKISPSHKKAKSIGTTLHESSYSSMPTTSTPLEVPKFPLELTSSGAETSNLTTSSSSSSLSLSSPTETPSPSSPRFPPTKHSHLFPSASQPATPSFQFSEHLSKLAIQTPPNSPAALSLSSSLSMTPKIITTATPQRASFESCDKRLFHHRRLPSGQTTSELQGVSSGQSQGIKRNWGLDLNISGTNGIVSSKKKEPK